MFFFSFFSSSFLLFGSIFRFNVYVSRESFFFLLFFVIFPPESRCFFVEGKCWCLVGERNWKMRFEMVTGRWRLVLKKRFFVSSIGGNGELVRGNISTILVNNFIFHFWTFFYVWRRHKYKLNIGFCFIYISFYSHLNNYSYPK